MDYNNILDILKFSPEAPLLFNTGLFLLLFVAFLGIYQLLRFRTLKMLFVIAFSLYFYYKSTAEYCFILLGVCISDYLLGIWMERTVSKAARRLIVSLNVIINVGMLVYFKYFNLLYETIADFAKVDFDPLDIVLPAGISFFTFRSISYIVDIYRGQIKACHNFMSYTFYLTFFPPLLAGPVVRAKDMLPQIEANPVATKAMVSEGLFLIMCGLAKKVIVADYISQNFVDRIFDNPTLYSGFENLMGMYGFAIQLYCDFSGYTDMAIGLALLMGYRFLDNFRSPFKSQNPTEFWHRWHISLSTWLRDYVYIPLGGNRCGRFRHHFNQMCTMVIGGLWHGASWMYMIWGALHGFFLVVHKELRRVALRRRNEEYDPDLPAEFAEPERTSKMRVALNIFLTFNLIAATFIFFRASDLQTATDIFTQIFTNFHCDVAWQFITGYMLIFIAMVFGFAMHFAPKRWTRALKKTYAGTPLLLQALVLAIVIFIIIQVRSSEIVPFVYLQY